MTPSDPALPVRPSGSERPPGPGGSEPPPGPPADPEDWDDHQWIAWLRATDGDGEPVSPDEPEPPRPTGVRRGGQVLGQAMLGLANAIYGQEEDDIVVVAEGPSGPGDDEGFTIRLDPDHPERSSVVFRRPPGPPT